MKSARKRECNIENYFHCAHCARENFRPDIGVGVTGAGTHLQVWCEHHDLLVIELELAEPMAPMACDECGKTGPHVH
jgi:hypothetical protein